MRRIDRRRGVRQRGIADLRGGFSLIELLVVVGILGLLASILFPRLAGARRQAQATVCASNVRQLVTAVSMYGIDHAGRACPGASDFLANLHRWHGTRTDVSEPFDSSRGPLVPYLGADRRIRDCPTYSRFLTGGVVAFERGAGGYGYNSDFIGRELRRLNATLYQVVTDRVGAMLDRIRQPAETVMFADSAFVNNGVIEYSFVTPRFQPTTSTRGAPSIHFRHDGRASVAWSDGHVDQRRMSFTVASPWYIGDPGRFQIGWFGAEDTNRYFDLN